MRPAQHVRRRPGRPPRSESADTPALILEAATRLFARRGYDAVSMRDIAAEVGVNVATVHHHTGSKAQLYEAVFARMYEAEREALTNSAAAVAGRLAEPGGDVVAGLHEILDVYIDFLQEHPEVTYLWLRRWLEPEEHRRLDEEYALPLYNLIAELLERADREGLIVEPHPYIALRSVVWTVHGHITTSAALAGPALETERADFRELAHRIVDGLYGRG
jgi:AcrR family transcriptional regulator